MCVCKCAIYTSSQTVRLGIPFIFHAIRIFYGWIPSCEGGHGQHIQHLDPSPVAPLSSKVLLPRGSTCRWCSSPGVRVRTPKNNTKKETCIKPITVVVLYWLIIILLLYYIILSGWKILFSIPGMTGTSRNCTPTDQDARSTLGALVFFICFWTNGSNSHIYSSYLIIFTIDFWKLTSPHGSVAGSVTWPGTQ